MTKRISIMFVFLLVMQTVLSGLNLHASSAESKKSGSLGLSIDSVRDGDGKNIDVDGQPDEDIDVEVAVAWAIDGLVEAGTTKTLKLPDNLVVEEQAGEIVVDGSLLASSDDEKTTIGYFNVSENGSLTFKLNETIQTEGLKGIVKVEGTFLATGKEDKNDDEQQKQEDKKQSKELESNETSNNEESREGKTKDELNLSIQSNDSKFNIQNSSEKHGFKLELDEILDLDDEAFDEQHPMGPHEQFKLKLNWELEDGHNYVAGDKETFDLPKGIEILDEIEIELTDEHGQVVANAVITPDKKAELTFTDFVEGHSAVSGWMEIISELDISEVEEEDGEVIIDPIGEEGELRIPIEKSNKNKTIEKQGEPNKGYNADEINWSVTINKNKTSLENARVIDELPEGTKYKEGSLKVTKLKVDLDGNILGDGEEVEITPEVNENGELIVPLGDTNDAYRVEYVTEVTDDEKKNFENNATLKDDELDDVSAKSTITINRGDAIKKSVVKHYDPKTGIIEWQIRFNYNQKDLSDVTLADAWTPEGMLELVEDSLKFQEVSIDENGDAHHEDRKSTRLNSSHVAISYAVSGWKKKNRTD